MKLDKELFATDTTKYQWQIIYASTNVSLHFFVQLLINSKLQYPCTILSLPAAYTCLSAKAMEVTQPARVKRTFNLMELPHNTQKYKVSLKNLMTNFAISSNWILLLWIVIYRPYAQIVLKVLKPTKKIQMGPHMQPIGQQCDILKLISKSTG
jgi:hypothetical protein